ncbi:TetR/AcrR family transcriptional regulator [Bailinhaonella thermotolerans]|uniref:TetR/AcrR family transcriptional regulator n=1 Tax=Bailinhaonella thermotolerans TaxID=1070861 RepID=A0A3A4A5J6_9ACTN|nr:TetR/AcrR family transcriptional regulator [Bailinhaonella thermotolerans]RJL24126.1 TetR/AcrR family transcriptional regulator [Bailinhaonella thermotolerans]
MEEHNGPQSASSTRELRLLAHGAPPPERADAARNRRRILDAAARLFAEHGVDEVSMDAVARAAEVGKGTLFRRFGDRAGLAAALLDERERELQAAILSGPPPLGPGAPADARLRAFVSAYLRYLLGHLDLVHTSETASPGARYRIGAYRFWHRHVQLLLAEARSAGAPGASRTEGDASRAEGEGDGARGAGFDAHALLASLGAEHVRAMLAETTPERLESDLLSLVERMI